MSNLPLIAIGLGLNLVGAIMIIASTDNVLRQILRFMNRSGDLQSPGDIDRLSDSSRVKTEAGIGFLIFGFALEVLGNFV